MILLASQTHVHSDEAIIGLMGKHILEGRYFPFYMYGQPYNAGAALHGMFFKTKPNESRLHRISRICTFLQRKFHRP
jgi:hypothetical protein